MNKKLKLKVIELFGTQTEFAKATGIREPVISRFIRRHCEPSPEQKQIIADMLNVSVEYLFTPEQEPRRYSGQGQCYECRSKKDQ